jgi:hypothetical protein
LTGEKAKGMPRGGFRKAVKKSNVFAGFSAEPSGKATARLGKCCNFSNTCHQNDTALLSKGSAPLPACPGKLAGVKLASRESATFTAP